MKDTTVKAILVIAVAAIGTALYFWTHSQINATKHALASIPASASGRVSGAMPGGSVPAAGNPAKKIHSVPPEAVEAAPQPAAASTARTGEQLEYAADVSKLSDVATLRLQILDQSNFLGKTAWHLQAFAHTENPLRMVFELDDQFDSYSEARTLSSLQYEMHLHERGERVDSVQRMVTNGREAAPANMTATHVVPGTRDPLGFLQYLRDLDWSKSHDVKSPVYDGHKLYDVRAALSAPAENVSVPAGQFVASKIDIHVFDNGVEMRDARFAVYLANTPARTPVLLEAVLPFATARVELVKAKTQ